MTNRSAKVWELLQEWGALVANDNGTPKIDYPNASKPLNPDEFIELIIQLLEDEMPKSRRVLTKIRGYDWKSGAPIPEYEVISLSDIEKARAKELLGRIKVIRDLKAPLSKVFERVKLGSEAVPPFLVAARKENILSLSEAAEVLGFGGSISTVAAEKRATKSARPRKKKPKKSASQPEADQLQRRESEKPNGHDDHQASGQMDDKKAIAWGAIEYLRLFSPKTTRSISKNRTVSKHAVDRFFGMLKGNVRRRKIDSLRGKIATKAKDLLHRKRKA